jgi:hypothetical protein
MHNPSQREEHKRARTISIFQHEHVENCRLTYHRFIKQILASGAQDDNKLKDTNKVHILPPKEKNMLLSPPSQPNPVASSTLVSRNQLSAFSRDLLEYKDAKHFDRAVERDAAACGHTSSTRSKLR